MPQDAPTSVDEAPKRRLVVVDVESTGLRERDIPVEVAWRDVDTGEHGCFVPRHNVVWVREHGQPDALALNGYEARIAPAEMDDGTELDRLHQALRGQVLGGSNVRFDARMLARLFAAWGRPAEPWHFRLAELSSYAAGVLGLPLGDLPGLSGVCNLLGIRPGDHTAAEDVRATTECFQALAAKAGNV